MQELEGAFVKFGLGMRFHDLFLQILEFERQKLEEFDDTLFKFGLGMRFYYRFLQIRQFGNMCQAGKKAYAKRNLVLNPSRADLLI